MIRRSNEVDRELSTVPTGSCNCVCVLGRYSTTRCSAGRITTAINPKRLNAERWALGTKLVYLFALGKLTIEKESFSSPTLPRGPNCLLFKGPTCHRASWQPRQSATGCRWRFKCVLPNSDNTVKHRLYVSHLYVVSSQSRFIRVPCDDKVLRLYDAKLRLCVVFPRS
ncbi:hypothetical protein AVEN_213759-1 [Araneus ventricosus]|uniref:Uncharacterized protein n=1 Tax=Araneus ventricosus TaxID=182803 RepID=A0A4Y2VX59_ARAVE|nr:hypothetical protein AVEN_213759-1 [Araneus ventricosus]